jgi:hypothetical protein
MDATASICLVAIVILLMKKRRMQIAIQSHTKLLHNTVVMYNASTRKQKRNARLVWVKSRSTHWREKLLRSSQLYASREFFMAFRMTRKSVEALLRILAPHITTQNTNY